MGYVARLGIIWGSDKCCKFLISNNKQNVNVQIL